ncbi:MAG TPA: hypothetical protein DCL38_04860, partial [Lachnospiraceae bacterium]|nr:hypothetical protein [Lachnospiraceae bacterium]
RYQQFIRFSLGTMEQLPDETIEFLNNEGNEEILGMIRARALVDGADELAAIAGNKAEVKKTSAAEFIEKYGAAKEKLKTVNRLLNHAAEKKKAETTEAEKLAEEYHLKFDTSTNRLDTTVADALDSLNKYGLDTKWMHIAMCYTPTEDTPENVKDDMKNKGVKPLLDMILALKENELDSLRFSKNQNIESDDYWKNRCLLGVLNDSSGGFLSLVKKFDIELSEEQIAHINAVSFLAQGLLPDYKAHDSMLVNPEDILLNEAGLEAHAQWLLVDFFKEQGADGRELSERARTFRGKCKGVKLEHRIMVRDLEYKPEVLREGDTYQTLIRMITNIYTTNAGHISDNESLAEKYRQRKERANNENMGEPLQEELKRQRALFAGNGEEEARLGLKIREDDRTKAYDFALGKKWSNTFEGNLMETAKFDKFKDILLPVERDLNGSVKDAFKDNYNKNNEILRGMLSADEAERNKAVAALGKQILDIKLEPEFYTLENLTQNYIEVRKTLKRIEAFKLLHKEYRDIFEGEDFNDEEREYIRNNFIENEALSGVSEMVEKTGLRLGIRANGTILDAPKDKTTKEDKLSWGNDFALQQGHRITVLDETVIPEALKAKAQRQKDYEERKEELKPITYIYDKLLAKKAKTVRSRYDKVRQLKAQGKLSEEELRNKAQNIIHDTNKLLDEIDAQIESAKQLMDCIYNKGDYKKLSDKAKVFAADNGFEILSEEETQEARENLDKKWMEDKFTFTNMDDVKLRVYVNGWLKDRSGQLSEDQRKRWNDRFYDDAGGFYDLRCFQNFLRPVKRDALGRPLKGYEENDRLNDQDIEDFISGDSARMFKVMKGIGQRIAKIELPRENLTWDYLEKNFKDIFENVRLCFDFQNMYLGFEDFFESDVFTEEEQDKMRHNITEISDIANMSLSQYLVAKGIGAEIHPVNGRSIKQQAEQQIATQKGIIDMQAGLFEEIGKFNANYALAYQENGDKVRALSKLQAQQRGMQRAFLAERKALDAQIKRCIADRDNELLRDEDKQDKEKLARYEENLKQFKQRRAELDSLKNTAEKRIAVLKQAKKVFCENSDGEGLNQKELKIFAENFKIEIPAERSFNEIRSDFLETTIEVIKDERFEKDIKADKKARAQGAYKRKLDNEKLEAANGAGFVVMERQAGGELKEKAKAQGNKEAKAAKRQFVTDKELEALFFQVKVKKDAYKLISKKPKAGGANAKELAKRKKAQKDAMVYEANKEAVDVLLEEIEDALEAKDNALEVINNAEAKKNAPGAEGAAAANNAAEAEKEAVEQAQTQVERSMLKATRYTELIRFAFGLQNELSKETLREIIDNKETKIFTEILVNRVLNDESLNEWNNKSLTHYKKFLKWDHERRGEESNEVIEEE